MNDKILRYFQKGLSTNERVELLKSIENDDLLKQDFIRFPERSSLQQI